MPVYEGAIFIIVIYFSQEYEETLEQQKALYNSKLEKLEQLHQQKQVTHSTFKLAYR